MDFKKKSRFLSERGESQIGILLGALVIGVLIWIVSSFVGWWDGMKTSRGDKSQEYFSSRVPKQKFKKISIRKGYKMSFTKDRRK